MFCKSVLVVLCAGCAAFGTTVTPPAAIFSGTASFLDASNAGATLTFNNSSGGSGLLGGTLDAVSAPVPGLFGVVAGGDLQGASLDSLLTYSFIVDGPAPGIPVELLVDAAAGWTVAGNVINGQASSQWGAFGSVSVNNAGGLVSACNESTSCPDNGASTTLHAFTNTGDVNSVAVHIVASASNFFVAGNVTTVTVFADPVIHFAPGFDSTGYSIVLSPGIGNGGTAAPEPGTFGIVGLVLCGIGWKMRRGAEMKKGRESCPSRPYIPVL